MANLATELADAATDHTLNLLRVEAGMRKQVLQMLEQAEETILQELAKTDLTVAKKAKLQQVMARITGQISDAYKTIDKVGYANLEKIAQITSKQTAGMLDDALKISASGPLSAAQLTAIARGPAVQGATITEWWTGQDQATQLRLTSQIQMGLLSGESMDDIARRIRGTAANDYKDGVMATSRREAASITRTAVQGIANQARIDTLLQNDHLVKGLEWVATLDERTTVICRALDGKRWTLGLKPVGHDKVFPGSTAHWSCRSTVIGVTYSWEELANVPLKEAQELTYEEALAQALKEQGFDDAEIADIEGNQKASMDGQVAEEMTQDDWLRRKGDAKAREILGPSRYKLWKEGKLTVQDLTDQDNRPLTVAQLEEAFLGKKAPIETEGASFPPAKKQPVYNQKEIDAKLKLEAENDAKALAAIDALKINPGTGQATAAKWAAKVDAELPDATNTEKLIWIEAKAEAEIEAKKQATSLGALKKKLATSGGNATDLQQKYLDELTPDEKLEFSASVLELKAKIVSEQSQALKDDLAKNPLSPLSPDQKKALKKLEKIDPNAAKDVETHLEGLKTEIFSQQGLDSMLAPDAHPYAQAAAKAAMKKPGSVQDHFQAAQASINNTASFELEGWAHKPGTAGHKALAKELGLPLSADPKDFAAGIQAKVDAGAGLQVLDKIEAIQELADAKKALAAANPGASSIEIPDPAGLIKIKDLQGSYLAVDPDTTKQWVVKDSSIGGGGADHFVSEGLADAIYKAGGAPVPDSKVFLQGGKAIKVAEFVPKGTNLGAWKAGKTAAEIEEMHRKIQDHFVLDALLANWDVAGMSEDNILIFAGTPIRIDNGGALFFRAMGGQKAFDAEVMELTTLRTLNPVTARIFGSMTQSQIDDQIGDIIKRRSAILAAADADPKVRAALEKRIDWLEAQLQPRARPAAAVPISTATPGQIPSNISELLDRGRYGAGTSITSDLDAIEDHQLVIWRERNVGGDQVVKIQGNLTFAGNARIMAQLDSYGLDTTARAGGGYGAALPTVATHPEDKFYGPITAAAKTLAVHQADGNYNLATLQTFEDAKVLLKAEIAKGGDADKLAMLKHYEEQAEKVDEALKAKAKPDLVKLFELKQAAIADEVDVDGWKIRRIDSFDFELKTMQGELLTETGKLSRRATLGTTFEMRRGPVRATVIGFRPDARSSGQKRTYQGTVRINIEGTDDLAAINEGLEALAKMGIDAKPPTIAQQELLYLHKGFALNRHHEDSAYLAIIKNNGFTDVEKVEAVKVLAEAKYGVKLPRDKSGWGADYNPEGEMPSNGTGWRYWNRWDLTKKERDKILKDKVLFHTSTDPVAGFLGWTRNGGNITTTWDRLRTGIPLSAGSTPDADLDSGGGAFFYTNTLPRSKAESRTGFMFKGDAIGRIDLRSDFGDSYGRWEAATDRRGDLKSIAAQDGMGYGKNTGLLKNGVNLFDELIHLKVGSKAIQDLLIQELKTMGMQKWPDGRSLSEVIVI